MAELTPMEAVVARIFAEVLDAKVDGAEANFLKLGGHSIKVVRLQNRLRKELGISIKVRTIFESPTVRDIALELERAEGVSRTVSSAHDSTGEIQIP